MGIGISLRVSDRASILSWAPRGPGPLCCSCHSSNSCLDSSGINGSLSSLQVDINPGIWRPSMPSLGFGCSAPASSLARFQAEMWPLPALNLSALNSPLSPDIDIPVSTSCAPLWHGEGGKLKHWGQDCRESDLESNI